MPMQADSRLTLAGQQRPGDAQAAERSLAQFHAIVLLTFVTHVPDTEQEHAETKTCVQCHTAWPCAEVRLAAHNRDGF